MKITKRRIPNKYLAELEAIWATDKRMPTAQSRQAWCAARGLDSAVVNGAFWWRMRQRKRRGRKTHIPDGSYELPVDAPTSNKENNPLLPSPRRSHLHRALSLTDYPSSPELPSSDPPSSDFAYTSVFDEPDSESDLLRSEDYPDSDGDKVECNQGSDINHNFTCLLCSVTCSHSDLSIDSSTSTQQLLPVSSSYFKPISTDEDPFHSQDQRPVLWELSAIPFDHYTSATSL